MNSTKNNRAKLLMCETYSILKSFHWQLIFESQVHSNCFIHFPCWPKIKQEMKCHFHTNLQQIYFPSSNYSSRSIFQTSVYERMELSVFLIFYSHMWPRHTSHFNWQGLNFQNTQTARTTQVILPLQHFPNHPHNFINPLNLQRLP